MTGPKPEPGKEGELQFDRVVGGVGDAKAVSGELRCSACGKRIPTEYFRMAGKEICGSCRQQYEGHLQKFKEKGRSASGMARAVVFGIGAMIAGAALYYAIIAITGLKLSIFAIVIGYMVGYAVRRGSSGIGGRRYQILAVAFTYVAVALAYAPISLTAMLKEQRSSVAAPSGSAAAGTGASDATQEPAEPVSLPMALLITAGLVLALPVLSVAGSMPSGLISALIIAIGLRQAWRMTAEMRIEITGPFKIGSAPAPGTM